MTQMTKAALAALILTGGQAMALTANGSTAEAGGFDRGAWVAVAGKPDQSAPRRALAESAAAQVPAGTAKADVLSRLGEPDQRFDNAWAYVTGSTGFGGEYRALLVGFDDQDKVISARQVSTETWQ